MDQPPTLRLVTSEYRPDPKHILITKVRGLVLEHGAHMPTQMIEGGGVVKRYWTDEVPLTSKPLLAQLCGVQTSLSQPLEKSMANHPSASFSETYYAVFLRKTADDPQDAHYRIQPEAGKPVLWYDGTSYKPVDPDRTPDEWLELETVVCELGTLL